MMNKLIVFFSILITLLPFNKLSASHYSGADISTRCITQGQIEITVTLYWDCDAFATMPQSIFVDINSSCGSSQLVSLPLLNSNGTEISNLCPQDLANSTCNGGTLPGRKEFIYQDIVNISIGCDPFVISFDDCCRDFTSNVPSSSFAGIYLESYFNSSIRNCNQSPTFNNSPIPYFCLNQSASFNYAAVDAEGDSLVYSLVDALDLGVPLQYSGGLSGSEPIPGLTINSQTGQMDFLPSTIGNYIVVVRVEEYDRATGSLLSVINRDVQFIIISCNNTIPDNTSSGILYNLSSNAVLTSNNSIAVCGGETIKVNLDFTDSNAGDILSLNTNLTTVLPGAIMTTSGTNPVTAQITWSIPLNSSGKKFNFIITVEDDGCPVTGKQTFSYLIDVINQTYAGPDVKLCGSQKASLTAIGGSAFVWKSISGEPISSSNFSCTNCANPVASPSITTSYEVESNLVGACKLKDTVVVYVVPDFSYSLSKSASNACLSQKVQVKADVIPSGNYTYIWTGNAAYSNPNDSITNVAFNESGFNYAYVKISNKEGCTYNDSIEINVYTLIPPMVELTTSDSVVCKGDTISLTALVSSTYPASCNYVSVACSPSKVKTYQVGFDTKVNTTSTFPAPYGNYAKTGRNQFLYLANELRASGLTSKIGSIAFYVDNITGNSIYEDFTVSLTCTGLSGYYSNNWEGGLLNVILPRQIAVQQGWNTHYFDNEYEWDGMSNIVVEICFNNSSSANSTNAISHYSLTPFPSVLYYSSNVNNACSFIGTGSISHNRPNIRFTACSDVPNQSNYSFAWNTPLNAPGVPVIKTQANETTMYSITVSDKNNVCKTTETVQVRAMKPLLSFSSDPKTGIAPLLVNFNNTSASDVVSFQWNFGDGNSSTASNPANTYSTPGIFEVSLAGVNTDGCKDTVKSTIEVDGKLPNIITPNGDNLNDDFSMKIENLKSYKASIRNRWGMPVYEWTDPNGSWNADKVPSGVYYYVIEGIRNDDSEIKFSGNVTVIK